MTPPASPSHTAPPTPLFHATVCQAPPLPPQSSSRALTLKFEYSSAQSQAPQRQCGPPGSVPVQAVAYVEPCSYYVLLTIGVGLRARALGEGNGRAPRRVTAKVMHTYSTWSSVCTTWRPRCDACAGARGIAGHVDLSVDARPTGSTVTRVAGCGGGRAEGSQGRQPQREQQHTGRLERSAGRGH